MEAGILHLSYPPRGGTCVYFVKASSGGSPPRRTRQLRACALSPLGIRDTDRDAPPCRPRLGRSSRRRAGLPPSAAPPHEAIRARAMRRDGRSVRAWPVKKGKERSHGKAHDHGREERHGPRARVPTDLRPDGENVRTRGLHRRGRGEEPHALERQGLRAHERGLRALRHVFEGLPERRREEDAVQAPEFVSFRGERGREFPEKPGIRRINAESVVLDPILLGEKFKREANRAILHRHGVLWRTRPRHGQSPLMAESGKALLRGQTTTRICQRNRKFPRSDGVREHCAKFRRGRARRREAQGRAAARPT